MTRKSTRRRSDRKPVDYAAKLTETVLAAVENGAELPWRKSWSFADRPRNAVSGRPYTGVNIFICLVGQMAGGFTTQRWVPKGGMKELGTWFRKGEKPMWLWRPRTVKDKDEDTGEDTFKVVGFSVFPVWNVEQLKPGFDESKLWQDGTPARECHPIATCERIVNSYSNPPKRETGSPSYLPKKDTVLMPDINTFENSESFYSTLFHELGHSTGHPSRLDREGIKGVIRFGSETYSQEELIAEMTACLLCGEAGISQAVIENQVAYTRGWLKYLKDDPQALAKAASAAQKAANLILGN